MGKTGDATEMTPGHHEFPLSFTLPAGLPSSYESQMGFVRYLVKAKMSVPEKLKTSTTKAPFSVNSDYDLNLDKRAKVCLNVAVVNAWSIANSLFF